MISRGAVFDCAGIRLQNGAPLPDGGSPECATAQLNLAKDRTAPPHHVAEFDATAKIGPWLKTPTPCDLTGHQAAQTPRYWSQRQKPAAGVGNMQ